MSATSFTEKKKNLPRFPRQQLRPLAVWTPGDPQLGDGGGPRARRSPGRARLARRVWRRSQPALRRRKSAPTPAADEIISFSCFGGGRAVSISYWSAAAGSGLQGRFMSGRRPQEGRNASEWERRGWQRGEEINLHALTSRKMFTSFIETKHELKVP